MGDQEQLKGEHNPILLVFYEGSRTVSPGSISSPGSSSDASQTDQAASPAPKISIDQRAWLGDTGRIERH